MDKKFRTKNQRHAYDDEKRRESLQKKLKHQQSQKKLIKNALSDSNSGKSKKIVFDDEIIEGTEYGIDENIKDNETGSVRQKNSVEKPCLFEESDSDGEENYEIKIKSQFEGKTGQKLLNLQSTYNNDERFRLDERFKDDSESGEENDGEDTTSKQSYRENGFIAESNDIEEEKKKQLKVLETLLGRPIQSASEREKKQKKSFYDMVRFDASNEDHKRQQNNVESQVENESVKKKRKKEKLDKEERKKRRKDKAEAQKSNNKSVASQNAEKKFYKVSEDLKLTLKNRKNENCQFSLLAAFSKKPERDDDSCEEEMEAEDIETYDQEWRVHEEDAVEDEEMAVDSGQKTDEEPKQLGKVHGIAKEKFFFVVDDPRIEEGLTFINMKNSEEAGKAIENYDETRRDIREVLRLRWQKHRQRNNPFKKKIGGSNKQKQSFPSIRKQFGRVVTRRKR